MSATHKTLVAALNGRQSRVVANNTKAIRNPDGSVALRLHSTDILTAKPDGSVVVCSGGWRTPTTKDRINTYLKDGLFIGQANGVWHWHKRGTEYSAPALGVFADGDTIVPRGGLTLKAPAGAEKAARKLARQVGDYARLCAAAVPMPPPSGGDCWYCALVTVDKPEPVQAGTHCTRGQPPRTLQKTLGDASHNTEHLLSHMAEGYVVPSLVMHALKEAGNGDLILAAAFGQAGGEWALGIARDRVFRSVRRYIKRRLSLAGN